MKKIYYLIIYSIILCTPAILYSQPNTKQDLTKKMELFKMMKDPNINFNEVRKTGEEYFKNRDKGKGSGYKQYKRWEYFVGRRTFPDGVNNISTQAWNEIKAFKEKNPQLKASSNPWNELGPKTSANITTHWAPGIGRINAIAVDPNNNNIIYVGTPSGGLWKTLDEGQNWTPLTDHLPAIGVSAIAIDPNNTSIIYIGTGDRDANDTYSVGVLKSIDRGQSFSTTGIDWDIYQKETVGALKIMPGNSNVVFAGTSDGLYKTVNSGTTWIKVLEGNCEDIEFKPGTPNIVYAVSEQSWNNVRFFKSTDEGSTFTQITSGVPNSSRAFISVTPANSSYVYLLSATSSGTFGGVYRSTDSGASFSLRGNSPDIFGYEANDGYSQSYYDLCFAVSPVNSEEVHIGAITTWKSTNGGQSYTQTSKWYYTAWLNEKELYRYIHCDMHALEFTANGNLYSGSDGMICKTTDGFATHENTFNLTEGLGIRQFYGIGLSPTDPDKFIGGSQDNGTSVTINGAWTEWLGADGGDAFIDWSNPDIIYGTIQNGNEWYKSTDGGLTSFSVNSPGGGNWVIPWAMDFNNPEIIYVGSSELRKTEDGMKNWSTVSNFNAGQSIDAVAVAPSNSNYLYLSKKINNVQHFFRSKDAGQNWEDITSGLPNLANTYIAVHPSYPEKVAVSFSGYQTGEKLYITENAGDTWTNYSANLPNLPANCVLYHDLEEDGLYIGMDVGVYYREKTDAQWTSYFDGLPNVIINELEIQYPANKLRAGTFGRGMWETDVYRKKTLLTNLSADRRTIEPDNYIQFTDESQALLGSTISSWHWEFPGGIPESFDGQNPPPVKYLNIGYYNVSLTATNNQGQSSTKTKPNFIKVVEEFSMKQERISACFGKFYSSGMYYDYKNNESLVSTIHSGIEGKQIILDFVSFELEYEMDCNYDYLEIYDGASTSSPLIGKFCSINSPGTIISNNPDGALTLRFVSDNEYVQSGWEANIMCK